jgi:glutathione-regulated potassium-efflux system ancillary protein KefG
MMNNTLLLVGHPNLDSSVFNVALINAVKDLPHVHVHYIAEHVDVAKEQELLLQYQHIVVQSPFYWYSVSAQTKNYIEKVFAFGFAMGAAYKLTGKKFYLALTTAGLEEFYQHGGLNKYTMAELLKPMERTFEYCKASLNGIFVLHNAKAVENGGISKEDLDTKIAAYKKMLQELA